MSDLFRVSVVDNLAYIISNHCSNSNICKILQTFMFLIVGIMYLLYFILKYKDDESKVKLHHLVRVNCLHFLSAYCCH